MVKMALPLVGILFIPSRVYSVFSSCEMLIHLEKSIHDTEATRDREDTTGEEGQQETRGQWCCLGLIGNPDGAVTRTCTLSRGVGSAKVWLTCNNPGP
jgi:hypothetical protein